MDFRFPQDGDTWFGHIKDKPVFRVKFDYYYLCLMLGLSAGRKLDPLQAGRAAPEFVGYFVDDYKASHRLITGLLVIAELKSLGIEMTEKKDVRKRIAELFDPGSPTGLSEEGMRLMNSYACGGFDYLCEKRERPHYADDFLLDYQRVLDEAVDGNKFWAAQ